MNKYNIHRGDIETPEATVEAYDASDALNRYADEVEGQGIPAFWHQDDSGTNCLLIGDETYYAKAV